MISQIRLFCGLVLTFLGTFASGQYAFTTYDHTSGLQLDKIQVIKEDSLGYIWLGGTSGISKFDGYRFTNYHLGDTSYHVAGNIVNDIAILPDGRVVIAYDDRGLSIFSHETQSFKTKQYEKSDGDSFPRYSIFFIHIVNDSMAYLGANREGLYLCNLNTMESRKIPLDIIPRDMITDPKDPNYYYFTTNGLLHYNSVDSTTTRLTNIGFVRIKIVNDEIWYNGYFKKVIAYNFVTRESQEFNAINYGVVRGWELLDNEVWIGMPEGIEVVNRTTKKVDQIIRAGTARTDLKGNFIYAIHKDRAGRIWVGTNGGLSMYDPYKQFFSSIPWLSVQASYLTRLDTESMLLLDFYERRALIYDTYYRPKAVSIDNPFVHPIELIENQSEDLILFFNGVGILDRSNLTITPYDCPFNRNYVRGLIDLEIEDQLWVGIYRYANNLILWDRESGMLDTISLGTEPRGIITPDDGTYWVYGVDLLAQYDPLTKKLTRIALEEGPFKPLGHDIQKIDRIGDTFWISTKINGVWTASYRDGTFILDQHYDTSKGLRNLSIVNTVVDPKGRLVVQCRSDIFIYDPKHDRFNLLGDDNDINTTTTYGLAAIDSTIYALGYQSKSIEVVDNVERSNDMTPLIEKVLINGKQRLLASGNKLKLNHKENNITIGFSTIDYINPKNVEHRYRLNEASPWVELDRSTNEVHLAALNDGDYTFQLSASYGDGKWYPPTSLSLDIAAPLWKRWWFVLLISLLVGVIGTLLYRYRIKQLHQINDMRLKLSELESESLRAQMNPHFVFNALNSIKSYIIKSSVHEAADYLTTFSELIRAVLHNSKQKEVSLSQEMEALTLYLQIENFRLNHKFDYTITIDNWIDPNKIVIPPLIIQPFVENSIWHGFVHKQSKGLLRINIFNNGDKLHVEIIDDGVGRAASRNIEQHRNRKRSYGIAITKNRLDNLATKTDVIITDLTDDNGESSGTQVTLILPLKSIQLNE